MEKKITIVGAGYVGISLAILISRKNSVLLLDIDESKVNKINKKKCPISDSLADNILKNEKLNLKATIDSEEAFTDRDVIILAVPTDYDRETNSFNTLIIEKILKTIFQKKINPIMNKKTFKLLSPEFPSKMLQHTLLQQ